MSSKKQSNKYAHNSIVGFTFALLGGVFGGFSVYYLGGLIEHFVFSRSLSNFPPAVIVHESSLRGLFYKPLSKNPADFMQADKAVVVDMNRGKLKLINHGEEIFESSISINKNGDGIWEPTQGEYRVITKEDGHYSRLASLWFSHAVSFSNNFFIHGDINLARTGEEKTDLSFASVRLQNDDAETVFQFVDVNTPIYVLNSERPIATSQGYSSLGREPPKISAESYIVADLDNGFIFAESKNQEPHDIASITKLMTAMVATDVFSPDRTIAIDQEALDIQGDSGTFEVGEVLTINNLYSPLLLSSSNDASHAIAKLVGLSTFTRLMNDKVARLGLNNTIFRGPSGLERNLSTPNDLIKLLRSLRNNYPDITRETRKYSSTLTTATSQHTWYNFNWKSGDETFIGGKMGASEDSGKNMAGIFRIRLSEFDSRDIGIIVLASDDERRDVERLIKWLQINFVYGRTNFENQAKKVVTPEAKDEIIRLMFVGDIMMDRGILSTIKNNASGDFSFHFKNISESLRDADILFGNLEGPISENGSRRGSVYSFRMPPETLKALYDEGFDIMSLANNHMGDYGREAMEDTFEHLKRAGIKYVGAGSSIKKALEPTIIERGGLKVGYLAFSDVGPKWMSASVNSSGILIANESDLTESIRQANTSTDILVVSFHFGEEYETSSHSRQQKLARMAIDEGANIVIGHHPHVVQEVERYNGGVIAYSLGNFIFDQAFSKDTKEGLMLTINVSEDGIEAVEPVKIKFNELFQPELKNKN
jgi:D-alanyl-D-alanine carboxypeptidase